MDGSKSGTRGVQELPDSVLLECSQSTNLMTSQEIDLQLLAAGDRTALLHKYERLIHKLARKFAFTAPNADHDDLVQEGRIGILKAIETYDESYGAGFMTWAYYHVRGAICGSGRSDRRQPRFPLSVEDADRRYNLEDESQEIEVRDDLATDLVRKVIAECCGGLHTKRASIVMDRYGLLGRKELRNKECAAKYGLTKFAVNSHTYSFKLKAREKFPELADFV
jgi:RNA polymerase sporulation-specific sigma factor